MSWFDYFRSSRTNTAQTAKERLQIVIAHERANRSSPDYLPKLKKDILNVIAKYVPIKDEDVNVQLDREGEYEVLELNITLPEPEPVRHVS